MISFYFVYVLISEKDGNFYTGFTCNLDARLLRHYNGEVPSTSQRRPLNLIFYEAYLNKADALRREKYFKTTKGKATLRVMLTEFLNDKKTNKFKVVDSKSNTISYKKRKIIN